MKKNKKLISILVACIILCATSITCFAYVCQFNHEHLAVIKIATGNYICNRDNCGKEWETTTYCTSCDAELETSYEVEPGEHSFELRRATCNGRTQTWYYRCTKGLYTITSTRDCPSGPHTGTCTSLPLGNVIINPEIS